MCEPPNNENLEKVCKYIKNSSLTKQLLMGSASGWTTGVVLTKVGKPAALGIGISIILYQAAHNQGYIKTDWDKLKEKAKESAEKHKIKQEAPNVLAKVKTMAKCNIAFTAGFIGGFLVGLGC